VIRELYVCPWCRREAMGPDDACGGSFLDYEHPAAVAPVLVELDGDELLPEHEERLRAAKAAAA
jgi:hypothetical protein